MEKYLLKYPEERLNIEALEYALGEATVNTIANEALKQNKKIKVESIPDSEDGLTYKLI